MNYGTPRDLANDVSANITSVQALLDAVDTSMHILMDRKLWGSYWTVMEYNGGNIQTLLAITEGILHDMELAQRKVVQSFYGKAD